ncbi:positive regulation of adiponectin secretion [Mactra antiquata]
MSTLGFIFFILWSSCCHSFLLDDDNSLQTLLTLLNNEKTARTSLENDIVALRSTIDAVEARQRAAQCNCPVTKTIAFSATLTSDINPLGDNQVVLYDNVITNVGGAYDVRHGAFRAPVSGAYKFTFSVLQGTSQMWIAVDLVKNGAPIGRIRTGDYSYYAIGTNIVTVHLDAGDDVWVQHQELAGSDRIMTLKGGYSMFTGHLIQAD